MSRVITTSTSRPFVSPSKCRVALQHGRFSLDFDGDLSPIRVSSCGRPTNGTTIDSPLPSHVV